MDIKVYNRSNYSFIHSNMDNFKANRIRFCFTKKFNKQDMVYMNILPSILTHSTKKYNTSKKMSEKLEELYCPNIFINYQKRGNNQSVEINMTFINPKYTNDDMYKESFLLLKEILFNPNVKDNEFIDEVFETIKKQRILQINKVKEDGSYYGSFLSDEITYKGTPLEYNILNILPDLEKVTNKELYSFYKCMFNDSKIDVVSIGNNDDEILIKYVDKLLKDIKTVNEVNNFNIDLVPSKILNNVKTVNNNQSTLFVTFVTDELSKFEKDYVLCLFNFIFGYINESLLFTCVREENNLCYSIYSYLRNYSNTIVVESGINYKNYKKTITLIKKVFNDMSNLEKIDSLLDKAKNTINLHLNDFYENSNRILEYLYKKQYEDIDDVNKQIEIYETITSQDVVNLTKKIHLLNTFLLEGKSEVA